MRKTLPALLVLGTSSIALSPALASWDPWPCEVVLCMANPAGLTAAAACVPPIQRLWREMPRPRFRMPTCQQQSYPDTDRMVRDIHDVIATNPNPTAADIQAGMTQTAVQTPLPSSTAVVNMTFAPFDPCEGGRTQVISTGFDSQPVSECRGPQIGWIPDGSDYGYAPVFEGYLQAYYPGQAFDIYINGQFWQRVRPGVGITYVGAATGGSWSPQFEPMPEPPAFLPIYSVGGLPENSTAMRTEIPRSGGS